MRRTPLTRKTPLRRTAKLGRNRRRSSARRALQFGQQADLCRVLPCAACWLTKGRPLEELLEIASIKMPAGRRFAWPRVSDPSHDPSVGAGGLDKDTTPLCRDHHLQFHALGRLTFRERYGYCSRALAADLQAIVLRHARAA